MSYPRSVRIVEVGPRDGLQNEPMLPNTIPVDAKVAYIRKLLAAGLPAIEVGAFVRPDLVPQMADSEDVVSSLGALTKNAELLALVPNMKGFERAKDAGIRHIAIFSAASEAFNSANIRSSIEESMSRYSEIAKAAKSGGIKVRGYLSTCWWCPFSGAVPQDKVRKLTNEMVSMGCDEVSIADTIGYATPIEVRSLLEKLVEDVGANVLGVHFHDTRGTALSNVMMALELGISTIDSSAGGLGGCPFAPGAAGNLATEELVFMLHGMNIETGVDLQALREASLEMERALGRPLPSRYLRAGPLTLRARPWKR